MAPLKLETAIRALRGILFGMIFSFTFGLLFYPPRTSFYSLTGELHHRPSHDVTGPQQVELFVGLVEREYLECVTDLALGHKRQNFADVGVAAPVRAAENLFARHPREEWN